MLWDVRNTWLFSALSIWKQGKIHSLEKLRLTIMETAIRALLPIRRLEQIRHGVACLSGCNGVRIICTRPYRLYRGVRYKTFVSNDDFSFDYLRRGASRF